MKQNWFDGNLHKFIEKHDINSNQEGNITHYLAKYSDYLAEKSEKEFRKGKLETVWACGRPMGQYQSAFPLGLLNRIQDNVCDIENGAKVLFPFGGTTPQKTNWTVNDINEELDVDTHHDARNLPDEWSESFDVVISDPPYNEHYAEEYYDVEYPRPKEHFVEAAKCVKPGGYLIILDWLVYENYCPKTLERETVIGITSGPKQRIRALNVFRKYNRLDQF